ncbi:glutathione S-transferase [Lyophyllum atratum]|nr:glutathione S-transferase [Lyophyllum atratum]
MSNVITLYDIPFEVPGKAYSPNTWKTRLCLNYKGIPYQTVWLEYLDIEPLCKKIGASPTEVREGVPLYTLPVIHDPSTGAVVADSAVIAQYLDASYPDTPTLFPPGTYALQHAFIDAFMYELAALWQFVVPVPARHFMSPAAVEYYRKAKEPAFGKKLEDMTPVGKERDEEWAKVKMGFEVIEGWFKQSEADGGPYLLGANIAFVDLAVVSFMMAFKKTLGAESESGWKDVNEWSKGRWEDYLQLFTKYQTIVE